MTYLIAPWPGVRNEDCVRGPLLDSLLSTSIAARYLHSQVTEGELSKETKDNLSVVVVLWSSSSSSCNIGKIQ